MYLTDYGFHPAMLPKNAPGIPARVTAAHRDRYEIVCERGPGFARLKGAAYYAGGEPFPTAGDFVLLDWQEGSDSRILATLPRRSLFSRPDPATAGHTEQAVAANFDTVFILQSLNRDFSPRRLERYLTEAWQSGAVPAVLLTKADLCADPGAAVREAEGLAPGVGVFPVSALTGAGLGALAPYLEPGRTVVFLGSSGVGKSSLVNALAGEPLMATGGIREDDGRGRHTTTHRQLLRLPSGVLVIDTPGMRELGMWDVSEGLGASFSDVEMFLGACRFRDCRHQGEPGCAVAAAIEDGSLSRERWESYLRLRKEARFSDDKVGYLRDKQRWHKSIAMQNRVKKR